MENEKSDSEDSDDELSEEKSESSSDEDENKNEDEKIERGQVSAKSVRSQTTSKSRPGSGEVHIEVEKSSEAVLEEKRRRRFGLPWFFTFIGWGICISTICISIFFIWAYAVSFGNDLTYKWLSSTIFSFFAAVLIVEPLKILAIACLFSLLCRKLDLNEDEDLEDDEYDSLLVEHLEDWQQFSSNRDESLFALDEKKLERIRKNRLRELKNWWVILILKSL